ncbi:MAG TPA: hypothetical protein VFQ35_22865 [Polyangiaceae bacterium]|nr:hypothetical protein [Polyangiaceae bacterium]
MNARRLAAAALLASACGGGSARFPTTDPNEEPPRRRPPGIAVDPVSRLPEVKGRSDSRASLVVLGAPRSATLARGIVARYFRALVGESPEALDPLLSEQAFIDTSGSRQPARGALRSRFLQLDYTALRGVPLYRDADLEIYRAEDAEALRAARSLPTDIGKDQLFVRVRLNVSHAGKTRVFANEMGFLLRPEQEDFRIVSIREDTPVP